MNDKDSLEAKLQGVKSAIDKLDTEYEKGRIEVGRYLQLRTDYVTCKTKLEKELDSLVRSQRMVSYGSSRHKPQRLAVQEVVEGIRDFIEIPVLAHCGR